MDEEVIEKWFNGVRARALHVIITIFMLPVIFAMSGWLGSQMLSRLDKIEVRLEQISTQLSGDQRDIAVQAAQISGHEYRISTMERRLDDVRRSGQ